MANLNVFVFLLISAIGLSQTLRAQEEKTPNARPGFQLRLDSLSTTTKVTGQDKKDAHVFAVKTARIAVAGGLTPTTNYLIRLDIKNAGFSEAGQDGAVAALDRAYIATKLCENFDFKIGRFPLTSGSLELDYSSIDQYLYSYFSGVVGALTPMTVGIEGNYSIFGQTLGMQVTNGYQDKAASSKGTEKSDDKNVSVYYRGRLFENVLKPIVSYNSYSRIKGGDDTNDGNVTSYSVGIGTQVSLFNADFDIEYDTFHSPNYRYVILDPMTTAPTSTTKQEQEIASVIGQFAYNLVDWHLRPFVKVTSEKEKIDGDDGIESARMAGGIEWFPGPSGFRYHLVYVSIKDKKDNATTKKSETTDNQQLIVGVAAKL